MSSFFSQNLFVDLVVDDGAVLFCFNVLCLIKYRSFSMLRVLVEIPFEHNSFEKTKFCYVGLIFPFWTYFEVGESSIRSQT